MEQVISGTARRIIKPGHLFSRIHVDDIFNTVLASFADPSPQRIYNVCDDEPAEPADLVAYVCNRLNQMPPKSMSFEEAQKTMSEMGRSFWNDNRRVSNDRIKKELGVSLRHPTYREGLDSIIENLR